MNPPCSGKFCLIWSLTMAIRSTVLASAVTLALMSFQSVSIAALQDDLVVWDSSNVPSLTKDEYSFKAADVNEAQLKFLL